MNKHKKYYIILFLLGALAVMLGAFGAHGLTGKIPDGSLASYKTATFYHFIHVIIGLISLHFYEVKSEIWFRRAAVLYILGVIAFSGSLYLLSTRSLTGIGLTFILGPLTPIGGILFTMGWLANVIGIINFKKP